MRSWATKLITLSGLLAAAASVHSASAEDVFCRDIKGILKHSKANFVGQSGVPTLADALPPMGEAKDCALSATLSGRNAYHCAQRFEYRSEDARRVFEAYDASLRSCFGDMLAAEQDLGVNHPDSYDLRTYQRGGATIALSLKDKGALQATYVFVRVTGAATE